MTPVVLLGVSLVVRLLSTIPSVAHADDGRQHLSTRCPGGLVCHHGGSCATGDKDHISSSLGIDRAFLEANNYDLPWLDATNVNGEHCVNCHEGWAGVDCRTRYVPCDQAGDDDEDAAGITCFNGGTCYVFDNDDDDDDAGHRMQMCDCTDAGLDEGDGKTRYAGKFCQHVRAERCGHGTEEMFCTNGGTCAVKFDEVTNDGHRYGCDCPSHRGGTHCEFLADDELVECNLDCKRGSCARGIKTYTDLIESGSPYPLQLYFDFITPSGEHCVCPNGYTGLKCEIQVTRCGESSTYCYNGSTCSYDVDGNPMCDCSSAHTDEISYAGLACEQVATTRCAPGLDQDEKDSYCANHGACIEDAHTRYRGCKCEEGWYGDLCDIEVVDGVVDVPDCDLTCENGGSCRFGVKGYKDAIEALNLHMHATKHEDGMYCSCPDGYTGLKCEVRIDHCPEDGSSGAENQFCLNGVPCSSDDGGATSSNLVVEKFGCQCEDGASGAVLPLAGRFCEFAVTEFCSRNSMRHSHSFCTNGGKCKVMNEHDDSQHHGCCCPDGYEGEYCQLPAGTTSKSGLIASSGTFNECQHAKSSTAQDANNLSIRAPPSNGVALEATAIDDSRGGSHGGGIASGVTIALVVVALAGVAYRKRSTKDETYQFDAEWWKGGVFDADWWRGENDDGVVDSQTNIAPITLSRQWSYPATSNSMSEDSMEWNRGYSYPNPMTGLSKDGLEWEKDLHDGDNSDLHDVII